MVIGEANYSTWSMRPWVFLTGFEVAFEAVFESLVPQATLRERLLAHSPAARVPVLVDGARTVWDSLAICEYVSETYLNGRGLPADMTSRATARSIVAEMHSGFGALRDEMPMNIRARRAVELSRAARADIARIDEIWATYADEKTGWLFGEFSMADCFYAPVAMRFLTYDVQLSDAARRYHQHLCECSAVQAWRARSAQETSVVPKDEVGAPL